MSNEVNIEELLEEFENEWQEDEAPEVTEPEEEVEEVDHVEEEEPQQTEETPNPNDDDADKRNRAFADLRRQAEENKRYADFIQALAKEGGVTPEDILSRYQERKLEEQAQTIDPVEVLKRQNSTQAELDQLKESMRAERMSAQIDAVSSKYGATDDDIRETFKYMVESGIDPRVQDNVDFEKFYRATNFDKILQKEVESARQKDLDDKKKRQESAAIGNGSSVSPSNSNEWSDEEFEAELAKMDIRL